MEFRFDAIVRGYVYESVRNAIVGENVPCVAELSSLFGEATCYLSSLTMLNVIIYMRHTRGHAATIFFVYRK